ncbi:MAG: ABC transporter permease [Chloroflexi bacterium]|nr:ABC transporter permease [Chloroflexota bacterium]
MSVPSIAPRADRVRAAQQLVADRPAIVLTAILVILLIATNVVSPGFIAPHQLSTTLLTAAALGVLAAGQTIVMLTGGIDLSVANTATAAAYVMAQYGGHNGVGAVLAALAVGLLVGLINGVGVGIFRVQPLIMTLGMIGIITGVLTILAGGKDILGFSFANGVPLIPDPVHQLGSGFVVGYVPLNVLLVWAPVSAAIILGLRFSGLGRTIYAVGDNPVACRLAGVRVWQVLLTSYTICGFLSAVSGILFVGLSNAADLSLVVPYLLPSVAAVVIGGTSILGGTGGYGGTILGALILTVLDSLLTLLNASQAVRQVLYGAIILALAAIYARISGAE